MTQGGPADTTNLLQFYGYKKSFAEGMIGYGSAIAVVVFLLSFALSVFYIRLLEPVCSERGGKHEKIRIRASVAAIGTLTLLPFSWFVLTSWKSAAEIIAIPPVILPSFIGTTIAPRSRNTGCCIISAIARSSR